MRRPLHNPATLDPSEASREKLRLKQQAVKATPEADMDRRLRRALLRKFMGQQTLLNTGDLCDYWRDASAGSNSKLRWRGPAVSSCVKQVHLAQTPTSTGLGMGLSYFVRLQNMSKLRKLLSTSLRRPLTPWSLQRMPSNTSETEVSHSMWT